MLESWQVNMQSCKVLMSSTKSKIKVITIIISSTESEHSHFHLTTGSTENLVKIRLFKRRMEEIIIPNAHFYTPRSYTYRLLCILGESHTCGLKALTSCIKNNFSRLTHSQIQAICSLTQE